MTLTVVPEILDPDLDPHPGLHLEPTCECDHEYAPCGDPATTRVTALCRLEGCACGPWTALACEVCLVGWRRAAKTGGYELRVHPLG